MNQEFSTPSQEGYADSSGRASEGRRNRRPPFNPSKYIKPGRGGDYLEVKGRFV